MSNAKKRKTNEALPEIDNEPVVDDDLDISEDEEGKAM